MALSDRAGFGFSIPQMFPDSPVDMALTRRIITRAEELGYESLWTQESILSRCSSLEPMNLLSYVAALTSRVRLGVSVVVFPVRNPVQLANSAASLDQMSGGRLILGIGIGGGANFETFGIPPERRVHRFTEGLRVMKALWTEKEATLAGDLWKLAGTPMEPKPVQQPHPPVWFGGRHPNALRRAVRLSDGWMGAGSSSIADFKKHVGLIRQYLDEEGRDPSTFPISKRLYLAIDDDYARAEGRLRTWFGQYYGRSDMANEVAVWGPRDEIAARIEEVVDAGADSVLLQPVFEFDEHLEALAEITGLKR